MEVSKLFRAFKIYSCFFQCFEHSHFNWDISQNKLTVKRSKWKFRVYLFDVIFILIVCGISCLCILLLREVFMTSDKGIPVTNKIMLAFTSAVGCFTIQVFVASFLYGEEYAMAWNALQNFYVVNSGKNNQQTQSLIQLRKSRSS